MNENTPFIQGLTGCLPIFMGAIVGLAGLVMLLVGVSDVPINLSAPEVPRWMIPAAGLMFFCFGLFAIVHTVIPFEEHQSALYQWLQYFLIVGGMSAFSAVFLWVGFGPGERAFESSTSIGPFTTSGKGDELIGRLLFGGFGLVTGLATLWTAISQPLRLLGIWRARGQSGEPK